MAAWQAFFTSTGTPAHTHRTMQRAPTLAAGGSSLQHCRAVKRSLGKLDLRSLGNGRYIMPVLEPAKDGLPFAMALELHERASGAEDNCPALFWGQAQPEEGLYALRYMLDCEPEAALGQGGVPLRPGDSVLVPHTPETWTVGNGDAPSMGGAALEWRLAAITLLLPKVLQQSSSGEVSLDATLAERSAREWHAAPVVGSLPPEAVTSLMTAARDRTRAAFPRLQTQPHVTPLNSPSQDAHAHCLPSGPHNGATSLSHDALLPFPAHAELTYRRRSPGAHAAVWGGQGMDAEWGTVSGRSNAHAGVAEQAGEPARASHMGRSHGMPDRAGTSDGHTLAGHVEGEAVAKSDSEGSGGGSAPSSSHSVGRHERGAASATGDREGSGDAGGWGPLAQLGAAGELILAEALTGALAYILPSIAERIARRLRQAAPRVGPLRRGLQDLNAFQLPNQTNRLALVFDPLSDDVPFTFGVEIFQAGHKTTPHTHPTAHELFFILAGEGEAFCDGVRFPVAPGDVVVFPPTSVHGIDTSPVHGKMYCLEMMTTDDMFAEMVRSGTALGTLPEEDLCVLAAVGCS